MARKRRTADVPYLLPRHPTENDRLDLMHHLLHEVLDTHVVAPITSPRTVLDVAAGTGQWAADVRAELPDALIVGIDLMPPGRPECATQYRSVRGNVLHGLPFAGGAFDLVHQRFLVAGVPVAAWSGLVRELVRVARPGGWVELVEAWPEAERTGPATERLFELGRRMARANGLDSTSLIPRTLDRHLRDHGLEAVDRRDLDLPVGTWDGGVGPYLAAGFRAVFTRLGPLYEARLDVPGAEWRGLVEAMQAEWDEYRSHYRFTLAFGRKPA